MRFRSQPTVSRLLKLSDIESRSLLFIHHSHSLSHLHKGRRSSSGRSDAVTKQKKIPFNEEFFYWMRHYNSFIKKYPNFKENFTSKGGAKNTSEMKLYLKTLIATGRECPIEDKFFLQMGNIARFGQPMEIPTKCVKNVPSKISSKVTPDNTSTRRELTIPPCLLTISKKSNESSLTLDLSFTDPRNLGMSFWMAHLREIIRLFPDFFENYEENTPQGEVEDYREILREKGHFCPSKESFDEQIKSILEYGQTFCGENCQICEEYKAISPRKISKGMSNDLKGKYKPVTYTGIPDGAKEK